MADALRGCEACLRRKLTGSACLNAAGAQSIIQTISGAIEIDPRKAT